MMARPPLGAVDRVTADRGGVGEAAQAVDAAHVHPQPAPAGLGDDRLDLGPELELVGRAADEQRAHRPPRNPTAVVFDAGLLEHVGGRESIAPQQRRVLVKQGQREVSFGKPR
jgi:hypothetical protein